jgi:glutamyl-tRNA synthetase
VFDRTKLEWVNQQWAQRKDKRALARDLRPFVERLGVPDPADHLLVAVAANLSTRATTLADMAAQGEFYFTRPSGYDRQAEGKLFTAAARPRLERLLRRLESVGRWDEAALEGECRQLAAELGVKLVDVAQPARLALTGRAASPPVFAIMADLGRDETLARLRAALARIPAA